MKTGNSFSSPEQNAWEDVRTMISKAQKMNSFEQHGGLTQAMCLLNLPQTALYKILFGLDALSLARMASTNTYFHVRHPSSRLPLFQHVAREKVLDLCKGDLDVASRFRNITWLERLFIEESTGCGFDSSWCIDASFTVDSNPKDSLARIKLTGMGPKLFLSDFSTADQKVLRWRLRVRGNTAAEFGVIPATIPLSHTMLHKMAADPEDENHRCTGFCSQITAGSLLPLKFPVMRGTIIDLVARRGHLQAVLQYPPDAKEIQWHNGQPVQKPYLGPNQLRFELDFCDEYDVCLAGTAWAKACYDVLHKSSKKIDSSDMEYEEALSQLSVENMCPMEGVTGSMSTEDSSHCLLDICGDAANETLQPDSKCMLTTDGVEYCGSSS